MSTVKDYLDHKAHTRLEWAYHNMLLVFLLSMILDVLHLLFPHAYGLVGEPYALVVMGLLISVLYMALKAHGYYRTMGNHPIGQSHSVGLIWWWSVLWLFFIVLNIIAFIISGEQLHYYTGFWVLADILINYSLILYFFMKKRRFKESKLF